MQCMEVWGGNWKLLVENFTDSYHVFHTHRESIDKYTPIDLFELEYLDPLTGRWRDEWDSSSVVGEKGRLPTMVKVTLVLNGASRRDSDSSRSKIRLVTKVILPIQDPLTFALK